MIVYREMLQRTPPWYAARRGLITASEVGMFLIKTDAKSLNARQNLIDKKIGELADGDDTDPGYEDYWMKRGTRMEEESMAAFTVVTGREIEHVGLCVHDSMMIGCSPDALVIGHPEGVEGKCPCGKVMIGRLRDGTLPDEYKCQIHHSMIVTGFNVWHFWSYHPRMEPLHVVVERDSFTDDLECGLLRLCDEYRSQAEAVNERWMAWRKRIEGSIKAA